jgi:UMF1 family MFS transporter
MSAQKDQSPLNRPTPILGWAFYDFANTIFSILVVTRYLPPMLKEMTGGSSFMGAAASFSMILAGLMVPILGSISDRTGRKKQYLFTVMFLCVSATCLISFTDHIPSILLLFFMANMAYQISMVFYNSLLPSVCTGDKIGAVSGLGVALGYVGSFFALLTANLFVRSYGIHGVFFLTGLLFFIFSLPLFIWVREKRIPHPEALSKSLITNRIREVIQTVKRLPADPPLLFFLLGNFFCLDAVNTTIIFYSEFLQNARGIPGTGIDQCLIAIQLSALIFSIWIGRLSDRFGPKAMILVVTAAWIVAIGLVLLTDRFVVILAASVLGGLGLGGIWVTGRTLLIQLTPSDQIGKFMGLYGMTGKFSAVGALIFGIFADLFSYNTALGFQILLLVCGFYFFSRIRTT